MKNGYIVHWEEFGTDRYDNWDWRSRSREFEDEKDAKRFFTRLLRDDQKVLRNAGFEVLK